MKLIVLGICNYLNYVCLVITLITLSTLIKKFPERLIIMSHLIQLNHIY